MARTIVIFLLVLIIFGNPVTTRADDADLQALVASVNELKDMVKSLQRTVSQQQTEINDLQNENRGLRKQAASTGAPEAQASEPPSAIAQVPAPPPATARRASYLPDIGAIADIVAFSTESKEDGEGNDKVSVRDFELVLGHDIDPYSRLDATIVFSDTEDPELEEAYASLWDLPFDTKARVGRLKPRIGRVLPIHRDSLDTVDVPVVIQRYFGAEGLSKSGAELSWFTPLSLENFTQEFILGGIEGGNGEEGQLFGASHRIPTLYGRLRHAFDLSDETNTEFGLSWLSGSTDNDSGREVNAIGVDLMATHFVTPRNKFKLQSEFYIVDRDPPQSNEEEELNFLDKDHPWGYYVLADYRLGERWGLGTRWDWVEPIATESEIVSDDEYALAGYLTFYQSEFARWRLQYQYARLIDDTNDNRVYFQGTFAIGTHKHQLQ